MFIEPKGLNGFHVKSVLRLFISSNEKWVVPATEDERRYFVLDVSGRYSIRQASADERGRYFRAIRHELLNGGRAAFLHFLKTYDLTGFDVRDVPNTTALAEQKAQGLKNIERWWYGILQTGEPDFPVFGDRGRSAGDWADCPISVDREEFRQSYSAWMKSRRFDGDELRPHEIGKRLLSLLPVVKVIQRGTGKGRSRSYVMPALSECRANFETWIGSQVEWPEHEDVVIEEADGDPNDDLI